MTERQGRLQGKIALVTGAGQGIGRATVLAFIREGAQVIATDMDLSKLDDMKTLTGVIKTRKVDVTCKEDIAALAAEIDRVDVIFNCAGIVANGTILECTEETWQLSMDVNVRSAFRVCQALIPKIIASGTGCSMVHMSSMASNKLGVPNRFAYSVSKAALLGLSKSIAADFMQYGIRSNSICPGTVDTPSLRQRLEATGDYEAAMKAFVGRQKMGRLGKAEEIAALVVYLASDESAYVTGTEVVIDGGWSV